MLHFAEFAPLIFKVLEKASYLPQVGLGEEIKTQYLQLAQVYIDFLMVRYYILSMYMVLGPFRSVVRVLFEMEMEIYMEFELDVESR